MDNKKKHRFNLIDIFVILIVLSLIGGTVFFTFRQNNEMKSQLRERNITYTLRISGVEKDFVSSFSEEEPVLDSSTMNYIGTITKVRTEKASSFSDKAVPNSFGNNYILMQEKSEESYDVYLTVSAKTKLDDRGVAYIDRQRITIGTRANIRCGNFASEAYITYFSIN